MEAVMKGPKHNRLGSLTEIFVVLALLGAVMIWMVLAQ